MYLHIKIGLIFLLLSFHGYTQKNAKDSIRINYNLKFHGKYDLVATDPLGYIYAVQGDVIFKFNDKGDTLYRQSVKQYGKVTSIDAAQSMRILFNFSDQQVVGFTDNTLSWHGTPKRLNTNQITFPTAICQSFLNNDLWVYDDASLSLLKTNSNLEVIQRNENMPSIVGQSFNPIQMLERNDKLYVVDSISGIFVFDLFGSLARHFPIEGVQQIDIRNEKLYYLKNKKVFYYDHLEMTSNPFDFHNVYNIKSFALLDKKVVLLNDKGIFIISQKR